ncbi:hypothetical protein HDV05_001708 [Chytridiales sp. JEL 0842]|nr:hypothetical protein HDV05_001708 [Chytridiales sp. JEL 0842]
MAITDYFSGGSNDLEDDMCGGFQLTRTQRFYGFGICFVAGFVTSILKLIIVYHQSTLLLATGQIAGFAVLYTIGNIISLLSTGFLIGFFKQFKKMFDSTRLAASLIFLVTMVLTLVVALVVKSFILTIICCIVQFLALFWYSASYIPFMRDIIKNCFGGLFK